MAKDLTGISNVDLGGDYLTAALRNKNTGTSPVTQGTPVIKEWTNDMVQFFQKLMDEAGLTANDLFDNESNGYQFISALRYFINKYPNVTSADITDVDDLTAPDIFYISNTAGISNLPSLTAGFIKIHRSASGTGFVMQEYTTLSSAPVKYYRTLYGAGNWSDWREIAVYETYYKDASAVESTKRVKKVVVELGDWDMDTTASINIPLPSFIPVNQVIGIDVKIKNNSGSAIYDLNMARTASSQLVTGGYARYISSSHSVTIERDEDNSIPEISHVGFFDSNQFDSTSYNRGFLTIEYFE